jgi:hypothetical protein
LKLPPPPCAVLLVWIIYGTFTNLLPQQKNISSCRGGFHNPAKIDENCALQVCLYQIEKADAKFGGVAKM